MIEPSRPRARKFVVPPEPPVAAVFDTTPPAKAPVSRVLPTEIDERFEWAVKLIQEDFGEPPIPLILRWMRSWSLDNSYNFAHTANAVGLAMISQEPLTTNQIVQELFVYAKPGHRGEALDIYKHFHNWMKTTRSIRFRFHHVGGSAIRELEQVFGSLEYQKMWYVNAE